MYKGLRKMLTLIGLCAVLLLPTFLTATDMGKMPAADGQALLDYITKTAPYAKWDLMPGTAKMRQGKEPHGALQTSM
ncbi:MAG: hypothetical protein A2051_07560 [Desulfovibrionales bacterium GWA2_65_9]|nr:MAG: hypothetical protein A2051_07560 [Desulfovibrionales bacterium GWA2_65_9]